MEERELTGANKIKIMMFLISKMILMLDLNIKIRFSFLITVLLINKLILIKLKVSFINMISLDKNQLLKYQ